MKDAIEQAKMFMRCRKFQQAISLLRSNYEDYKRSYEYYLLLAISNLYLKNIGEVPGLLKDAKESRAQIEKKSDLKISDTRYFLCCAGAYLCRGETDKAIGYYLDVINLDCNNVQAKAALDFIEKEGDYDTICYYKNTGRIEEFFPPLGTNPQLVLKIVLPIVFCAMAAVAFIVIKRDVFFPSKIVLPEATRNIDFTIPQEIFEKLPTDNKLAFKKALEYFNANRDNHALLEINKVFSLEKIDEKIRSCSEQLKALCGPITMTTLSDKKLNDNFSPEEVGSNFALYDGTFVLWKGTFTNVVQTDTETKFDLFVGDLSKSKNEYNCTVIFEGKQNIIEGKPITVFAQFRYSGGVPKLEGKSFH